MTRTAMEAMQQPLPKELPTKKASVNRGELSPLAAAGEAVGPWEDLRGPPHPHPPASAFSPYYMMQHCLHGDVHGSERPSHATLSPSHCSVLRYASVSLQCAAPCFRVTAVCCAMLPCHCSVLRHASVSALVGQTISKSYIAPLFCQNGAKSE